MRDWTPDKISSSRRSFPRNKPFPVYGKIRGYPPRSPAPSFGCTLLPGGDPSFLLPISS
ncbi:hypothetical protein B4135_1439 [Caldibacillus debilis]|uniref:Uncharacterized protein n=1 Tax=Caldibacillus debilis TaxID=301148 RepID=A0A150MC08_9BACI|nr:hypothetical protein B4135_1439 [Caldibacillus debilis]